MPSVCPGPAKTRHPFFPKALEGLHSASGNPPLAQPHKRGHPHPRPQQRTPGLPGVALKRSGSHSGNSCDLGDAPVGHTGASGPVSAGNPPETHSLKSGSRRSYWFLKLQMPRKKSLEQRIKEKFLLCGIWPFLGPGSFHFRVDMELLTSLLCVCRLLV